MGAPARRSTMRRLAVAIPICLAMVVLYVVVLSRGALLP